MRLSVTRGNLVQLVRAIAFSFESLAERQSIQLETRFPKEIPETYFDADKVHDILINILSNAFKFTPEGGKIRFLAKEKEGLLHIQISDSGKGIPQKDLDKIFNRFYQVEGTEHQGTGIGLSLVKELTYLHKGQIWVESKEGVGTTFFIELPYQAKVYSDEERAGTTSASDIQAATAVVTPMAGGTSKESEAGQSTADLEAPVALIIEDHPDLRTYIRDYLKGQFQVHLAENGAEGLKKAIQLVPDIIISDVMMPKMDGFALSEAIRKEEKTSHIPVILLTAKAGQQHKIEGLKTGADDYLTKPFDGKELQVRVRNLIEQRRRLREKFAGQLKIRHPRFPLVQ
jgi:CheY-like chemotaxis protein